MKLLKKIGLVFFMLCIFTIAAIFATGNKHLFKAITLTYLKGQRGPTINDYKYFTYNTVETGNYQPWAFAPTYNQTPLKKEDNAYHQKLESIAYLVIKDNQIVHESYWQGYNDSSRTNSFSVAKTVVSILVGCALQEGLIKNINDPVVTYLPEYKEVVGDKITIRHLLTMSSGINFDESYSNPLGMQAKVYYGSNLKQLVKKYKPATEAGKQFNYLGGNTLLLSFLVEKVTGKNLSVYASQKLWTPMGAKHTAFWSTDNKATERSSCCFYSNAKDFARIGKLYLDSGRWNGNQIVPQAYAIESTIAATDVMDGNQPLTQYGYQWWCYTYNAENIFYARGIKGQYIIVRPEKKMIIVRLGSKRDTDTVNNGPKDINEWIRMSDYLQ